MTRTLLILLALTLATGLTGGADAQAFDPRSRYSADDARDARQAGEILPAREIIVRLRQRYPGDEVWVTELIDERRPFYTVRVITRDGRRLDLNVDARTAAVIPERNMYSYRF